MFFKSRTRTDHTGAQFTSWVWTPKEMKTYTHRLARECSKLGHRGPAPEPTPVPAGQGSWGGRGGAAAALDPGLGLGLWALQLRKDTLLCVPVLQGVSGSR